MSLISYCKTEHEAQYIKAHEENPDVTMVVLGRMVGKDESVVRKAIKRVKNRAAIQGESPEHDMNHPSPDTHIVKGVSTLYGDNGNVKQQWVKTDIKKDAVLRSFESLMEGMKDDIRPAPPVSLHVPIAEQDSNLCNLYTIADAHLGILVSEQEGDGMFFDLEKGEERLCRWFDYMIEASPDSSQAVISVLGDLLHTDGYSPTTPQSGHILDASARFPDIIRAAIKTLRYIVQRALTKHEHVQLVLSTGNHDLSSTAWLRELFSALYEEDDRIRVDTRHKMYLSYQFGDVMLAFHHGDRKKGQHLPLLFATDFPDVWGSTKHRYAHTGHLHHQEVKEHSGMIVEQHSTLTPRDAYAEWGGYRNTCKASCITYHRKYGEVGRITSTPAMINEK